MAVGLRASSIKLLPAFILLSLAMGCSQGHCRRKVDLPPEVATSEDAPPEAQAQKPSDKDHVYVFKYDGSLQCKKGKAIAPETMAKELQGIPVYSSVKKSDGMMHIQVCGSITGMANVFEIPAAALKQAESRGFKKWSFE